MLAGRRLALLEFDMGWSLWLSSAQVPLRLGRHPQNDLCNTSNYISRHHCEIDYRDSQLVVVDKGSMNGSIVHNRHVRDASAVIDKRTCVLLSDMIFWITPCDAHGELVGPESSGEKTPAAYGDGNNEKQHGICLVDICDSVEMDVKQVNNIALSMRSVIVSDDQREMLLLKNMGDGYLVVYESAAPAVRSAERLLNWRAARQNVFSASIRVALDAGITYPSHGHDRVGVAICRVTRFEKTQRRDIELPGSALEKLRPRNRCLMSEPVWDSLDGGTGQRCDHIGARKLKGFADILHTVYQYPA